MKKVIYRTKHNFINYPYFYKIMIKNTGKKMLQNKHFVFEIVFRYEAT